MLSKCANPACDAKLHYLHEGKIFRIDTESLAFAGRRAKPVMPAVPEDVQLSQCVSDLKVIADRGGTFRPEYYWLCADCSQAWTIAVASGSVMVVPRARPLVLHAAAS